MLIGIDANEANLTQNRVGINQYAFELLHALYNLDTPHIFVIYLKSKPQPDLPVARKNWHYRVIPFPKLWTQTRLPVDLFTHAPSPTVFFSMTHYAPRWSPVPTVVAIMDLGFLSSPEQFTPRDFNQLKSWTHYSVKNAKKIIAISQFTKEAIQKEYKRAEGDIIVTHLSYNSSLFKPTHNSQILEKYGITKPYILFLSSLKPSKNIERLIEAYKILNTKYKIQDTKLVISGKKAWLFDQIFAKVKSLGIEDRVIFTGFVEESEKPVLMTEASAFVLPSLYEGFGIPVLEAMACGTPVVISKIASLPEVAGSAGIFVDPLDVNSIADGLQIALGPRSQEFVKKGLKRVQSFSWDRCAKETLTVILSAAKNPVV